jgi:predicted kinase
MRVPFAEYVEKEIATNTVLIACGLPATNKTETTEVVARIKGHTILRTDLIRKEVLKGEDIFDEKVASNMDKRKMVYDKMFEMAGDLAKENKGVILDATFVSQSLRRRAAEVAAKNGKTFVIQQTSCSEAYSLNKISKRTKENYESNALAPQAYYNNRRKFEEVDLADLKSLYANLKIIHLIIETESDDEDGWYVIDRVDC